MVILKEVSETRVVVCGRYDCNDAVIKRVWMPVKKRLVREGVVMVATYNQASDTTNFNFVVNAAIYDPGFIKSVCAQLQKRLLRGRDVSARILESIVGKRMASYMTLLISDDGQTVSILVNEERLNIDLLGEAVTMFVDEFLREFDGETPEEMAKDHDRDSSVIINNRCDCPVFC